VKGGEMPKRVYLIRHGETDGSAAGRLLGSTDVPLTARGMRQVERLAVLLPPALLATGTSTWCVASPLLRAQQTAQAVTGPTGLAFSTDPDLSEMDFGAWEGLTSAEVEERYPGRQSEWAAPTEETTFPEGENLGDFERRVARAQERIVVSEAEAVLVFAHGGVIRALACGLLGFGREYFWFLKVQPASVVRMDVFEHGALLAEVWSVDDREEV
jgi:ribonuclease H / adenosylcobalamin/alpha-ribazole phosphatase